MTLNHHQSNDSVASKQNNDVENLFKDQTYPGKCYKAEAMVANQGGWTNQ